MVKKILVELAKLLGIILFLFLLLKAISYLPAARLHPIFADKLVFLQQKENDLEAFLQNINLTYKTIVKHKTTERNFELLYNKLLTEKSANQAIGYENSVLREALNFIKQTEQAVLPAEIISRSADSWSNFVLVNKGAKQGVKNDMGVINASGLVGFAYEVFPETTRVILLTDPRFQLSCVNARNKEIGILTGQLKELPALSYINYNSDIRQGDQILTSGHSFRFRRGIPIGTVETVTAFKKNYYKKVSVKPAVNFDQLDILFFLKK